MGITGWVRNTADGEVEIMASGNDAQLGQFIDWCNHGPQRAIVVNVSVSQVAELSFGQFEIKR